MESKKFVDGVCKYVINGETVYAEYMGRQRGFECCVCGKGCNAHTFNVLHGNTPKEAIANYENGDYETIGFGENHLGNVEFVAFVLYK